MSLEVDEWGKWQVVDKYARVLVEPSPEYIEYFGFMRVRYAADKTSARADGIDTINISITILTPLGAMHGYTGQIPFMIGDERYMVDFAGGAGSLQLSSVVAGRVAIRPASDFWLDYTTSKGEMIRKELSPSDALEVEFA